MNKVDEYFGGVSKTQKQELERVRTIIITAAPEANEAFSYGMPAFKYKNKPLIYFGAFKNHYSVFPTSGVIKKCKELLNSFITSKGTIQYTEENLLPEKILQQLINIRKDEIDKELEH